MSYFPTFTPPSQGLFKIRPEMIVAILLREVSHMHVIFTKTSYMLS